MRTLVYIKMDVHDPLLLSEGVCRQLGLISYHSEVRERRKTNDKAQGVGESKEVLVPSIRVSLVKSVSIPAGRYRDVAVRVEGKDVSSRNVLLESSAKTDGLQVDDALLLPDQDGIAYLRVTNPQGFTGVLDEGAMLVEAVEARVISPEPEPRSGLTAETVRAISTQEDPERREAVKPGLDSGLDSGLNYIM